jgi:hypothetical protein
MLSDNAPAIALYHRMGLRIRRRLYVTVLGNVSRSPERARGNSRSNGASPRLRGHIANVVTLTERHAVMAEDVVGGRDVEIEVRECKAG